MGRLKRANAGLAAAIVRSLEGWDRYSWSVPTVEKAGGSGGRSHGESALGDGSVEEHGRGDPLHNHRSYLFERYVGQSAADTLHGCLGG
jgi:hypothetical protein